MKSVLATALGLTALTHASPVEKHKFWKRDYIKGLDVSHYQSSVDWAGAYADGYRFVMIKATEGTSYIDPAFSDHYGGATDAGFIRGGYHFAQPADSDGASQADYFVENGGGWSADGITLPGMLDIEYGPDDPCYGLDQSSMVTWITEFHDEYYSQTGRYPIIYSTADWWSQCTGDSSDFSSTSPLDLASWNDSPGTIPGGWGFETFWQYNDACPWGGDSDYFNGDSDGLTKMATG